MPKLGIAMETVVLTKWLKQVGDEVERGESIFEVETDKASQEVPAETSGVLIEQLVAEGEEVPLFAVVGRMDVQS